MKNILAFVVGLIVIAVVVAFGYSKFEVKLRVASLKVDKAVLDRQFLNRLAYTRMLETDDYREDMSILLNNYARDLDKLYMKQEYKDLRDDDAVRKVYQIEYKEGRKDEKILKGVNERIDYTQAVYKEITGGSYRPLLTAQNAGLRIDLYSITKGSVEGRDRLMVKVLVSASDPDIALTFGHIEMKSKIEDEVEKKVKGQVVMEKVYKLTKIEGQGEPNTLIKEPRKWFEDFPPGLMIGYYDFPLFHPKATEVKLTMGFSVRTQGGNHLNPNLEFAPFAIDSTWRLPPGASWEAEEVEATEEEAKEFLTSEEDKKDDKSAK
ncbi:MAG: hypothetical protein JXR83_02330 [Deltaproteobacteria bacterium]|nr:hypothetical protein [Deltaproteobacteria bacterium]